LLPGLLEGVAVKKDKKSAKKGPVEYSDPTGLYPPARLAVMTGKSPSDFKLKEAKKTKLPDLRVLYEVPVVVYVVAPAGEESDVCDTVLNYLEDWIPDESPSDPIHILDFAVKVDEVSAASTSPRLEAFKKAQEES
jgi:hypothetical protein